MREKELQRRLLQSTSTELLEELALRIRRRELEKLPPGIFEELERLELEELHFETLLGALKGDHSDFDFQEGSLERLFHLFVMLMLNDGFELVEGER